MPKDRDLGEHKRPPLDGSVCESSPEKKNLDRLFVSIFFGHKFSLKKCKEQSFEFSSHDCVRFFDICVISHSTHSVARHVL